MTGFDLIEQALTLLNYTTPTGGNDPRQNTEQMRRSLPLLNAVLADIRKIQHQPPLQLCSLAQELPVSEEVAMLVMVPGVAMYLAQGENDGDSYNRFSAEYAQRRSSVPKGERRVQDVSPAVRF